MTDKNITATDVRLFASFFDTTTSTAPVTRSFEYSDRDVDKFGIDDLKEYRDVLKLSRFFYKRDPIASTVVNKLIDIGVTDIQFFKGTLSDNELRIFEGVKEEIRDLLSDCALEYLLTGLAIPEIKYGTVNKETLKSWGVKKYSAYSVPVDMWVRDSGTLVINRSMFTKKSTYSVEIPDEIIFFILNGGRYSDGTVDLDLYAMLLAYYPDFVMRVKRGERTIKLDDPFVIEAKKTADSAYPIPYTYSAIESMKHKRNLRKMDYSIASRVITAIQLIKLGNDTYPLTESDTDQVEDIKKQIYWRDSGYQDIERVFQLFGNHTLTVEWVFPDTSALLDDSKYINVNSDIMMAFGFPKILLTGETDRTGTSDPAFAILSPQKTMEILRAKLLNLVNKIVDDMVTLNNISGRPTVKLSPMNLQDFNTFFQNLLELYNTGNVSRDTLVGSVGLDIETELQKRKEEKAMLTKYGLEEFSPLPHSNAPGVPGNNTTETKKPTDSGNKDTKTNGS